MEDMQKSNKNEALERKLKEELNWYILQASEEEYDEKAVESILYLLDRWDPIEDEVVPKKEEAWERFQQVIEQQRELLPVPEPAGTEANGGRDVFGKGIFGPRKSGVSGKRGLLEKKEALGKRSSKIVELVYRHKIVAAVILLCTILLVGNTIYAVTNPEDGFFFWMKRDDSGVEMYTSPEGLQDLTDEKENVFYNREDVPAWAQEWLDIESEVELPEEYEWQYFEANELENRQHVASHYAVEGKEQEIVLGAWIYVDQVSYYSEDFSEYSHIDSYDIEKEQMNVYKKTEKSGENFYIICFYKQNNKYYIQGQDNLDELKGLAEEYLCCVKNKI